MLPQDDSIISSRNTTGGSEQPPPPPLSSRPRAIPAKARDTAIAAEHNDAETPCHITSSSPNIVDTATGAISPHQAPAPAPAQQPRQHHQREQGESRGIASLESNAEMMTAASKPTSVSHVLTTAATGRAWASTTAQASSVGASGFNGKVPPMNAATTDTSINMPSATHPSDLAPTITHKQVPPAPTQSAATGIAMIAARPASAMMTLKKAVNIMSPAATATATGTGKKTASGRWTREEHEQFLEGLKVYGREWKKVAQRIPTRTSAQIRSHAQKYFAKLAREEETRLATVNAIAREHQGGVGGDGGLEINGGIGGVDGDGTTLLLPPDQHSLLLSGAAISPVQLTSSAMNRVGRILSDPEAVQVEVEDTLAALRRRYHELQRRLYGNNGAEVDANGDGSSGIGGLPRPPPTAMLKEDITRISSSNGIATGKKRKMGEAMVASPATTTATTAQGPQKAKILENRELWTEELIALSVLGGSLQRGDSPRREEPAIPPNSDEEKYSKTCAHKNDANVDAAADTDESTIKKKAKKDVDNGSDAKE